MHTSRGRRRILISRRRWEAMHQIEKITDNEFRRKRKGNNGGKRRVGEEDVKIQEYRDAETDG